MSRAGRGALLPVALGAALVALSLAAFWPATGFTGFTDFDDPNLLIDNAMYRGLGPENLRWMFTTMLMGHYQPLTWLSYAIDYRLWGLDAGAFLRTNVLLHAASAVLVMALIRRLIATGADVPAPRAWAAAFVGAAAWAAHPLRVESVAWATERRDLLSTLLLVGAALAYLRAVRPGDAAFRDARWLAAACALLLLSLLSKAWGMTLFAVLLILDVYPLRRLPIDPRRWWTARGVLLEKLPFAALGVAAAVTAKFAQDEAAGAALPLSEWPVTNRASQAAYGLVFYLHKTLVPTDLVPLVELPAGMNWLAPEYLLRFGIVAAGIAACVALWRRAPAIGAAAAVYAVVLSPVLGTLQSGPQFVADRYSYVALIGWSAALAGGVAWALGRTTPRALALGGTGAAAVLAAMVGLTRTQTRVWSDPLTLWMHAAAHAPWGSLVLIHAGLNLDRAGRGDEALAAFAAAVERNRRDGRAWRSLGTALARRGRFEESIAPLRKAIELDPMAYVPGVTLGNVLFFDLGRKEQGLAALRQACEDVRTPRTGSAARRPLSGAPFLALGSALRLSGDLDGARQAFEEARAYPDARAEAEIQLRALVRSR